MGERIDIVKIDIDREPELTEEMDITIIPGLFFIKNGEVVSDTPDPSHAQFESDEPQKSTDMYFFNEDVKLGSDIEDIFDSIESDNKSNPENSETPATQAQETIDGGEE